MWIMYVLFYGLMKGGRDIIKKIALKKNTVMEVLVAHTAISLLFVIPTASDALSIDTSLLGPIALKSFFIFVAWICSFRAIKRLPVSVVGILDLSRVLFATFLGIVVLKETMRVNQCAGLFLVCLGLVMLKFVNGPSKEGREDIKAIFVVLALLSCMLNALSGLMDKILMAKVSSSQLQFYYMSFMLLYYIVYILVTRTKISLSIFKNVWIYILSLMFVLADKALFIANADPASRITVMTLIKQSCCIVTIIGGRLVFKEKNILRKLACAAVIIAGIMISIFL